MQSTEETEKTLIVRMKVLQEKLTIQTLEKQIEAKLASVEELKSKIGKLENRLEDPQKKGPMEFKAKVTSQQQSNAYTIIQRLEIEALVQLGNDAEAFFRFSHHTFRKKPPRIRKKRAVVPYLDMSSEAHSRKRLYTHSSSSINEPASHIC